MGKYHFRLPERHLLDEARFSPRKTVLLMQTAAARVATLEKELDRCMAVA